MVNIGDRVEYVPDSSHALDKGVDGDYPWVLGYRDHTDKVEELVGKRVDEVLSFIRRHPNPNEERKKLVLLRPAKTWPATVSAVNDDGTVNLDIQGNRGGVTVHYDRIPLDEKKAPHSCYVGPEG